MALHLRIFLAFLVCCALTGAGVALLEAFPVAAAAVLITCNAMVGLVMFLVLFRKETPSPVELPEPHLHWDPEIPRRGMGDLIRSVNHIAIIVSDVGRSLAFYTEIIGFQQIQRPNFDRHGAWLTMGNLELHLIKGVPNAPSGRDLIVSHIALDTNEPHKVLEKLLEYEVPFRQNISVPDPQKARENLVEAFENSEGKITQYFVRDPDGYYLELCNCDVLTAFCLFKENDAKEKKPGYVPKYKKLMDAMLSTYHESGQAKASPFRFPQLLKTTVLVHRLVRKARGELKKKFQERVEKALEGVEEAAEPDGQLLEKFMGRQKTYCDLCQGFSQEELASALCKSGNYAPTALLLLAACRQDVRVFFPPQYLLSEGGRIKQQVMAVSAPTQRKFGSFSMFASKPFEDADCSAGRRESFLSRISGTYRSSIHSNQEKPKDRRKSGLRLALAFDDDAKMQSYLSKSYSFARRQAQVSELEEEEICVWWNQSVQWRAVASWLCIILRLWLRSKSFFGPQERFLAFSFFPRKLVVKLKYRSWKRKRFVCDGINQFSDKLWQADYVFYSSFVAEEQELFWPARAISGIQFFSPQADCPFFKHIYICYSRIPSHHVRNGLFSSCSSSLYRLLSKHLVRVSKCSAAT